MRNARSTAIVAALLFFVTGGVVGVAVDRLLLLPSEVEATPLTVDAMVEDLELSEAEEARVREFMERMHPIVLEAAREGPDSLLTATRNVHQHLEDLLPPHARSGFHSWVEGHHRRMMERLRTDDDRRERPE
ncbi:MAG: hypothetical protein ACOC5J_00125 [Gemmatimonadota bacterium]